MIKLEKYEGTSKKTGRPFEAFKLTLGEYSTLLFPRSEMEKNYLIKVVDGREKI